MVGKFKGMSGKNLLTPFLLTGAKTLLLPVLSTVLVSAFDIDPYIDTTDNNKVIELSLVAFIMGTFPTASTVRWNARRARQRAAPAAPSHGPPLLPTPAPRHAVPFLIRQPGPSFFFPSPFRSCSSTPWILGCLSQKCRRLSSCARFSLRL